MVSALFSGAIFAYFLTIFDAGRQAGWGILLSSEDSTR